MYQIRLKELRETMEVKQSTIADYIGINKGRYSQYETEKDLFPTKHLNSVCNFFDVSFDYILGFADIKKYENQVDIIDNTIVGMRLKEFRKSHNLTQKKLAEFLKTVHPVIVNYENGKHLIALPFLYQICSKYKVSADYLLGKIDKY